MTDAYNYNLDTIFDTLSHRNIISNALYKGEVNITFTKADGTQRTMLCTLQSARLPVVVIDESKTPRKTNDATQVVWDITAGGWRSFCWDRVVAFNVPCATIPSLTETL